MGKYQFTGASGLGIRTVSAKQQTIKMGFMKIPCMPDGLA
jgi:hypothetical protein